jgi:hypothetical protein
MVRFMFRIPWLGPRMRTAQLIYADQPWLEVFVP